MASQFDNRNDFLTRYNYERERRRRATQVTPQIMSAHQQVGTPNVNPFQDNFTPNTNTVSMGQIAAQVTPQPQQPFFERVGRGAASLPIGIAALAESLTTDPLQTAQGMGESIAKHAAETMAISTDVPANPMYPLRLGLKAANKLNVPILGSIEPKLQELQDERKQAYVTNPILAPLDIAGLVGAGQGASALSSFVRNRAASRVPEIIRKAVEPEVVPEVAQKPVISKPQQVPEIIRQAVEPSTPPVEKVQAPQTISEGVGQGKSSDGWVMRPVEYRGGVASVFETPMGLIERVKSKSKAAGLGGDRWRATFENTEYLAKTPDEASQWLKQQRAGKISPEPTATAQDAAKPRAEFSPNDRVMWKSPYSGETNEYSFRGNSGDKAILFNEKSGMQISVPKNELIDIAYLDKTSQKIKSLERDLKIATPIRSHADVSPMTDAEMSAFNKLNAAKNEVDLYKKAISETTTARINSEVNLQRDQRVKSAAVFQRVSGWEIVKDNAEYVLRNPLTKEEVYAGKLGRVKEVAKSEPFDAAVRPAQSTNPVVTAKETEYDAFLKRHEQARADAKIQAEAEMARKAEQDAIAKANEEARQARLDASAKVRNPKVPRIIADAVTPKKAASVVKQEAQATSLTDKSFKAQMKSEIEAALRDAPDRPQELQDMIDSYNYLDENRRGMDWEAAEARLKEKRGEIDELKNRLGVKTVTIEIPGDGTFKIEHSKQSLLELQKRLGRNIETKVPEVKSTPRGGDRGLQGARLDGYDISVFGDATIRPNGTKGLSTIRVDYRNDPVAKKLGIVTNSHYLVEESALSKHPKQIQISDKMLDEKRVSEMLKSFDKVKYDGKPAKEVVTYNDGLNNKVIFDNGDIFVGFNGEYIEFLKNSVRDFSLKLSGETTPAAIMSGNKRVGVIMPLKTSEQFAITRPSHPIELGALGTPSVLHSTMGAVGRVAEKSMIPIQYIAKKIDGFMEKRGLANPLGTPEIVLKDTGIVEAFRDATAKEHAFVAEQSAKLREILGGRIKSEKYLAQMFRHLDNPEAILNPTEKALRGWFDEMLNTVNEFRIRRGEEPINYTEGYIPHIFKKSKELLDADQSIALPRKAQNRFANERVGAEGYEKDLIQALELYTKATARDMYVNDALHASIPAIEAMSKKGSKILRREVITTPDGASKTINFYNLNNADMWSKRGYAEAFVRAQLGLPTQGQRFFKQLGINPRTSQRVSNMATGLVYRNLLGMAIDTGVKNLSQVTHTIAENGMAPTLRGIGKFLTPEGIKTARAEHLLKEFDAFLLSEDMPAATRAKIFKQFDENVINGAMRFSEFVNRGIAYHTALDDAIKAGKSITDAHEIALKAVRGTQFEYNKLGTSPFMRGPLTRPAAQFMTFPVKTSEMLYRWANEGNTGRGKLLRYFATVGGLVYAGKEVGVELGNIFFDPTKTVDKDSKGGIELPLSGNKVKLDPLRLGTTGFAPQGAVPAVTKPYKYINDLITKDRTAGQRVGQAAREFLPGGRFIGKAVDVATGSEYRDERGRLIRKDSKADAFLKLFGGRSSNQELMNNKKTDIRDVEQEYYETRRKIIDTQLNGDVDGAKRMIADFSEKYPYLASRLRRSLRQGRKDERRKKQMSSDERFMESSIRKQIEHNL